MWDKLLNFMTLEPVDTFKPEIAWKLSVKMQFLVRLYLVAGVLAVCVGMSGPAEWKGIVVRVFAALLLGDALWKGFRKFEYAVDLVIHMVTVGLFAWVTLTAVNPLIGICGVVLVNAAAYFELQDLLRLEDVSRREIRDWAAHCERTAKVRFWVIWFGYWVLASFTSLNI